jgi:hypothetical protein
MKTISELKKICYKNPETTRWDGKTLTDIEIIRQSIIEDIKEKIKYINTDSAFEYNSTLLLIEYLKAKFKIKEEELK